MPEQEPHVELAWTVHPAAGRHVAAAIVVAVILAFAVVAGLLMRSPWWAAGAVVFFGLTLNRFFFPSRFSIDREGITACYPLQRRRALWTDLRRFAHDQHGGHLSRRARPSRLGGFRDVHVLFGDERETIVARIRAHLASGVGSWAP